MIFRRGLFSSVMVVLLSLAGSGCNPHAETQSDEQKDPYYLSGINRRRDLDYKGAIEAFEKALEINPRSASAHYELAIIFDEHEKDYAAALYHYDRVVKLRPSGAYPADNANQRIAVCKQELAKSVSIAPMIQTMQSDMVKLQADLARATNENQQLRKQLEAAQQALAPRGNWAPTLSNLASQTNFGLRPSAPGTRSNSPSAARVDLAANTRPGPSASGPADPATFSAGRTSERAASKMKTHTVVSGDNPAYIARKYSIKLNSLMAANPNLDARRLKVGQVLNIP